MKKLNLTFLATLMLLITITSCDKKDDDTDVSYLSNIANIGENVILVTYQELASEGVDFHASVVALEGTQTAANLDIAKNQWRDMREPWEKSEGFLFGPVDDDGIDPAIDSWPVDVIQLDSVLASSSALTESYIDGLIGEMKGFHTAEYLLWGPTGNKEIGDITAREFEYLKAVSENLKKKTTQLHNSWKPTGGNYVENFIKAGTSASKYASEKDALTEIAEGMSGIADEVGAGKIGDPLSQQDISLEESQFSDNSKNDFADNIRSIRNAYNGNYNTIGLGLYEVIKEKDATVADKLNTEIDAAISAIEAIPGTFTYSVINNQAAVTDAKDKVLIIQATIDGEVLPIISNL